MAYSFKGSISFGLVFIPVTLHSTIKANEIGFNMLDKKTLSRVKYSKTCVECDGRIVQQEDIVKGYEYEKGKYVVFTPEDFEKIKTNKDKTITIERFISLEEIDPIYFDRPYYVKPLGAENAYALLTQALEKEKKIGIAKMVMGSKETLVALRSIKGKLLIHTLFFSDEIQDNPVKEVKKDLPKKEIDLAVTIINSMSEDFHIEDYHDEYQERIKAAIEKKIAGKQIVRSKEKVDKPVADLMEALQESLKKMNRKVIKNKRASKKIKKLPKNDLDKPKRAYS